jgi:alpha-glucosidase
MGRAMGVFARPPVYPREANSKEKAVLKKIALVLTILGLGLTVTPVCLAGQSASVAADGHPWWQHAVFYELYPRSFADSNGDGIGDLNGITSRLDYLQALGVDAVWITPCYPSPQVDFGYDVSDYEAIDPMYGTLQDFDRLVKEAQKHGIRIIMDFVLNHTSDQHKWFLDSRSSRTSAHRDWYVWRDGKSPGVPPNNWLSLFGHSAWQWDEHTKQYYYHFFYPQQPDLNWRNPAVEKAMLDVTRWWYRRGVGGFRLDAVDTVFEDPALTDNPVLPGKNVYGDPNMRDLHNQKLPEDNEVLQRLRAVADQYGAVLIGETNPVDVNELASYYGSAGKPGLQLPMDYLFTNVRTLSATEYRNQIDAIERTGRWPVYLISNHDIRRPVSRYGDGLHDDAIAKVLAGMYLTLRGTAIMYYGEELGMENNDPTRREDVKDPIGKLGWPLQKGRDGERTPMQWTEGPNAGFSPGHPWLPVPASYKTHNVASELADPNSVLRFYRQLLKLRHTDHALLDGEYVALNPDDPHVLSYLRRSQDEALIVILNMSAQKQHIRFDLAPLQLASRIRPTLTTMQGVSKELALSDVEMEPFGVLIGRVGGSALAAKPSAAR